MQQRLLEAGLDHYLTKPLLKWAIHGKLSEYIPKGVEFLGELDLK
jgi:hypothetical protein